MSSSGNNDVPKKNKGRQKVKMARMEKDSNRQVTFSKRRCGLFKKASELCTLCGAEAAIIVFSPGKKAFSFGHPSVEAVLNRFLGAGALPNPPGNEQIEGARRDIDVHDLNMELTLMNSRIEAEKKRGEELSQMRKARAQQYWWDIPHQICKSPHRPELHQSLWRVNPNLLAANRLARLAVNTTPNKAQFITQ